MHLFEDTWVTSPLPIMKKHGGCWLQCLPSPYFLFLWLPAYSEIAASTSPKMLHHSSFPLLHRKAWNSSPLRLHQQHITWKDRALQRLELWICFLMWLRRSQKYKCGRRASGSMGFIIPVSDVPLTPGVLHGRYPLTIHVWVWSHVMYLCCVLCSELQDNQLTY